MAANDFIQITRSSTNQSQNLGNSRDALRQAASQVLEVYANMQHLTDGSTFTAFETAYGLSAGQGTVVYSALKQVAILFGAQNSIDVNIDKIINGMR
jgi:hypothetical protein